ncbi:MAG: glycosyltransferase [Phycisphaerae bacterium]|nr:glycosyltransferase [Phycisphaerae bacterium]
MRIVHFLDHVDFRRGGPANAVTTLVRVLRARGHTARLACLSGPDLPTEWIDDSPAPTAVILPCFGARFLSPSGRRSLERLLEQADLLHLHGVWEPANVQAAGLAHRLGVPVIVSLRGMLDDWCMARGPWRKRLFLELGGRRVLERAATVHCTAEAEREQSFKWFPRGHATVVPNLMDLTTYAAMPGPTEARVAFQLPNDGVPTILFLSRLSEKKGLEHLFAALKLLAVRGHRLRTVVAGTGSPAYVDLLRREAASLDSCTPVHFVGHVGGLLKCSLFEASDVFVLPSSQENFGFVFFESLAAGLPVITTDLVDTWKEIEESGGGFITRQEAGSIADAIERALADRDALRARGAAGRAWVLEHLCTDRVAERFESMYRLALEHSPSSR